MVLGSPSSLQQGWRSTRGRGDGNGNEDGSQNRKLWALQQARVSEVMISQQAEEFPLVISVASLR